MLHFAFSSSAFVASLALGLCPAACAAAEGAAGGWHGGLDLTLEASAGLHGGLARRGALQGLALGHCEWQPAAGTAWQANLYFSALGLAGAGPTERFAGDFLAMSNIEGFESARLYSCWVELARGPWSVRTGALLADEEFTGTASGACLANSAFGWPAFISANTVNTGPAFYAAALGLRVAHTWSDHVTTRIGLYDGDTFDSASGDPHVHRWGLRHRLTSAQGCFAIVETTLVASPDGARWKLGAWFHSASFADLRDDETGRPFALTHASPRLHPHNHGTYAALEKTLRGQPGRPGHWQAHVRAGVSPSDRNAVSWAVDAALAWTGPLATRPDDVLAVGFVHAAMSHRAAATARWLDPHQPAPDREQVLELTYRLPLTASLELQPDAQFIRHPGGNAALPDAFAFLLRLNLSL